MMGLKRFLFLMVFSLPAAWADLTQPCMEVLHGSSRGMRWLELVGQRNYVPLLRSGFSENGDFFSLHVSAGFTLTEGEAGSPWQDKQKSKFSLDGWQGGHLAFSRGLRFWAFKQETPGLAIYDRESRVTRSLGLPAAVTPLAVSNWGSVVFETEGWRRGVRFANGEVFDLDGIVGTISASNDLAFSWTGGQEALYYLSGSATVAELWKAGETEPLFARPGVRIGALAVQGQGAVFGIFEDGSTALTLIGYDLGEGREIYGIDVELDEPISWRKIMSGLISPGTRYFAFRTAAAIYIVDLKAGQVIKKFDLEGRRFLDYSFESSDPSRLRVVLSLFDRRSRHFHNGVVEIPVGRSGEEVDEEVEAGDNPFRSREVSLHRWQDGAASAPVLRHGISFQELGGYRISLWHISDRGYITGGMLRDGRYYVLAPHIENSENVYLQYEGLKYYSNGDLLGGREELNGNFNLPGLVSGERVVVSPRLDYFAYRVADGVVLHHRPTGISKRFEGFSGVHAISNWGDLVLQGVTGRMVYLRGELGHLDDTPQELFDTAPDVVFAGELGRDLYYLAVGEYPLGTYHEVRKYGQEEPVIYFPGLQIGALAIHGGRGVLLGSRVGNRTDVTALLFDLNPVNPASNEHERFDFDVVAPMENTSDGVISEDGRYYAFGADGVDYILDLQEREVVYEIESGDGRRRGRGGFTQWEGRTWYRLLWKKPSGSHEIVSIPFQSVDLRTTRAEQERLARRQAREGS